MPRLRFVHAADLHLDSPFHGLRSVNPDIGQILQQATFQAYTNIIELCMDEQVDALLVAGDIYDGADRSLQAQLRFYQGLGKLNDAGIASFICHGNHDPLNSWLAQLKRPPLSRQFRETVEAVPLDPGAPERAIIYGTWTEIRTWSICCHSGWKTLWPRRSAALSAGSGWSVAAPCTARSSGMDILKVCELRSMAPASSVSPSSGANAWLTLLSPLRKGHSRF